MSTKPIIISVQGGNFSENATMVSVIKDCLRERGFSNVVSDSGLPGDDRASSEHMLNTQVPHLKTRTMLIEGLTDFDFHSPEVTEYPVVQHDNSLLFMM